MTTAAQTTADASALTASERSPQEWVAGFIEGWRAPRSPEAFAAHFRPLLSPDVRLVQPQLPPMTGYRAFEERFVRPVFGLIPDLHGEVERWVSDGETIYIELTLCGTLGGRSVRFRACDRIALRDGVAYERESYFDPTTLLAAAARSPRAWPAFVRMRLRRAPRHNQSGGRR